MKKLLVTLVVMVAILSTFVGGCAKEETTTPAPAPAPAPAPKATPAPTPAPSKEAPVMSQAPAPEKPSATAPEGVEYGGTLKYLYGYSPSKNIGWPLDTTNTQSIWGTNFVFAEPLVLLVNDATVRPYLATSWELSDNKSAMTFHLRKGVRFHDGTTFNADAVKFTLDKVIEAGRAYGTTWQTVEIIDDYTVRLNFSVWRNSFWNDITTTGCMFTSPTAYREKGQEWVAEHPIGTGPFKFVKWERDQYMKFEKNTDYWQPGKPCLDKLEFITVKDRMTQQAALLGGEGDVLALQDAKEMADAVRLGFQTYAFAAGTTFMAPDSNNPDSPFANKLVREAFDYAIDRQSIVDAVGYGYKIANYQLPTPVQYYYNPNVVGRAYNVEKAKALLTEAGYPNGLKTKLYVLDTYKDMSLIVQQMLKAAGIDAQVDVLDNLKFWDMLMHGWSGGVMFAGFAWGTNFASNIRGWFPPAGWFFPSLKMPDGVLELIDKALATTDFETQKKLNQELSKMLVDNCTVMVVCSDALGTITKPSIHGAHWMEGADWEYWSPADTWKEAE